MKTVTVDREVESTITGERIAMGIDLDSLPHLMDVLTDLYEDSEGAIVREISTNARDAHIEAGCPDTPIEITLPTDLAPFFRVKDHGCGLSKDDIINIYSKYGASTKRDTNDQTGALGLGCKSPLTYTDQFTLISVKDGTRIQMAVSRDAVGASMTVVDEAETTEGNGTEVIIPAKRWNSIEEKCERFFRFWEPGTVLVNGEQPQHFTADERVQKVSDTMYLIPDTTDYVVMANVAYPATGPSALKLGLRAHGTSVVVFVGPTEIDHSKSREGLRDTPNTLATIQRIREDFAKEMKGFVQRLIDAEPNHIAGLKKMLQWKGILPPLAEDDTYTYKGTDLPTTWKTDDMRVVDVDSHKLNASSKREYITAETFASTIWVYGYDRDQFTVGQKKKLLMWLDSDATQHNRWAMKRFLLFPDGKPNSKYIPDDQCVAWDTIKALKLPRTTPVHMGGTGRIPGSYDFYENGVYRHGVPGDEIDSTNPVFYVDKYEDSRYNSLLGEHYDDYTVVVLTSNRVEKFMRLFPTARHAREGVKEYFKTWVATVTDDMLKALAVQDHDDYANYLALNPARVNDPELREAIRLAKIDLSRLRKTRDKFARVISTSLPNKYTHRSALDKYGFLRETYSYYRHLDTTMKQHASDVYLFINCKYADDLRRQAEHEAAANRDDA